MKKKDNPIENLKKNKALLAGLVGLVCFIGLVVIIGLQVISDNNISVKDLRVTNITDTSFAVSWISDDTYEGQVVFKEGSSNWPVLFAQSGTEIAYEDKDVELNQSGEYVIKDTGLKDRFIHHVTIKNLKPETVYSFRVKGLVNGKSGEIDQVSTISIIEDLNTPDPAYGKVVDQVDSSKLASSGIVYYQLISEENDQVVKTQVYSALITENGTWSGDVGMMLDYEGNSVEFSGDSTLAIETVSDLGVSYDEFLMEYHKPLPDISVSHKNSRIRLQNAISENSEAKAILDKSLIDETYAFECDLMAKMTEAQRSQCFNQSGGCLCNINGQITWMGSVGCQDAIDGECKDVLSGGSSRSQDLNQNQDGSDRMSSDDLGEKDLKDKPTEPYSDACFGWDTKLVTYPASGTRLPAACGTGEYCLNGECISSSARNNVDTPSDQIVQEGSGCNPETSKCQEGTFCGKHPLKNSFLCIKPENLPQAPTSMSELSKYAIGEACNWIHPKTGQKVRSISYCAAPVNRGGLNVDFQRFSFYCSTQTNKITGRQYQLDDKCVSSNYGRILYEGEFLVDEKAKEVEQERTQEIKEQVVAPPNPTTANEARKFSIGRPCGWSGGLDVCLIVEETAFQYWCKKNPEEEVGFITARYDGVTQSKCTSDKVGEVLINGEFVNVQPEPEPAPVPIPAPIQEESNKQQSQSQTTPTPQPVPTPWYVECNNGESFPPSGISAQEFNSQVITAFNGAYGAGGFDRWTKEACEPRGGVKRRSQNGTVEVGVSAVPPVSNQSSAPTGSSSSSGATPVISSEMVQNTIASSSLPVGSCGGFFISQWERGRTHNNVSYQQAIDISKEKDGNYPSYPLDVTSGGGYNDALKVLAPVSGRVDFVNSPADHVTCGVRNRNGQDYYDGGFVIGIRDNYGNLWGLAHLENVSVTPGQEVSAGQHIAYLFDGFFPEGKMIYSHKLGRQVNLADYNDQGLGGCFHYKDGPDNGNVHLHFYVTGPLLDDYNFNARKFVLNKCSGIRSTGSADGSLGFDPRSDLFAWNNMNKSVLGLVEASEADVDFAPVDIDVVYSSNNTQPGEAGSYNVDILGTEVTTPDVILGNNMSQVQYFVDENRDGVQQTSEEFLTEEQVNALQVNFNKEASVMEYSLNSGWNLIHIPMVLSETDEEINTAKKLLEYWNDQGADIAHVAKFTGGRLDMYSKRETGDEYTDDFIIYPGEGMFVMNLGLGMTVDIPGNEIDDGIAVKFINGWNLVGMTGYVNGNSEDLLDVLVEDGVDAMSVSQFENGIYDSVIKEDGLLFGNNFNLVDNRGYFVRVKSGGDTEVRL
jgi:hypothetical protein